MRYRLARRLCHIANYGLNYLLWAGLAEEVTTSHARQRRNYSGRVLGHGSDAAFRGDTGAADPVVTEMLTAFAAGRGSERAALEALARGRLLVPVVAAAAGQGNAGQAEMATPVLIGRDGRPALPAFSCLDALQRWQPAARPVPVPAASVWRAAVAQRQAVVIDVAGPVPLEVDGARLAALAAGDPVPPPERDPDVRAAVAAALAGQAGVAGFELAAGESGTDLTIVVRLAAGSQATGAEALGSRAGPALQALSGTRLRRGVTVTAARP